MNNIKNGDNILVIWNNDSQSTILSLLEEIKNSYQGVTISLENSEMLTEASRPHSSFDIIISNWSSTQSVKHTDTLLATIIKLLKPCGKFILKDITCLGTTLKINGFVNVTNDIDSTYVAEKPKFEVGSKATLKLNGKPTVWKLDNTVEEAWTGTNDDDIIDDNNLLDSDDLKIPDKNSLKVCATTGKRKACADCSCGLAEELMGETKQTPKSSCGSCYLGDAFRCAACPYLGMPAFKPGEKVMLNLKSDI